MTGAAIARKYILFVLLAIMIVAITYDYLYARPAVEADYLAIVDESARINAIGDDKFTNYELRKLNMKHG